MAVQPSVPAPKGVTPSLWRGRVATFTLPKGDELLRQVGPTSHPQLNFGQYITSRGGDRNAGLNEDMAVSTLDQAVEPLHAADVAAQNWKSSFEKAGFFTVFVEVSVKGVFKLDTVAQLFATSVGIIMQWHLPDGEAPPTPEEDDGDWVPIWTPKYKFVNRMSERHREIQYSTRQVNGQTYVQMEATHFVEIYEPLELENFPIDLQDLTIQIISISPLEKVRWLPPRDDSGEHYPCCRVSKSGFKAGDFQLTDPPMVFHMIPYHSDASGHDFARVCCTIKVQRLITFYMLNVNLVMFLITVCALGTFAIHPSEIGARQDAVLALILAAVGVWSGLSSVKPPLSYVTIIEKYIGLCFLTLAAIAVTQSGHVHVIIHISAFSPLSLPPYINDDEPVLLNADSIAFYAFVAWTFCFNIAYYSIFFRHKSQSLRRFTAQALEEQDVLQQDRSNFCRRATITGPATMLVK